MRALTDRFGRVHDYLRISLTDKCNLRCHYCMPENAVFRPHEELLSKDELLQIATTFVNEFGVKKIRLTGGEPLVRKDAAEIIEALGKLPVELALTTNGILLKSFFPLLKKVGLRSLNISLDSLVPWKNQLITKRHFFDTVKKNIETAVSEGFSTRVNMVVIRGVNEDEILDFVNWTKDFPLHIRFIEFMPFDGNNWNWEKVISFRKILEIIESAYPVEKLHDKPNSTAKSYRANGFKGTFAVISTITCPFCDSCNRIRLTADGRLKNCLFAQKEADLITPLRNGMDVKSVIENCIAEKEAERGGLAEFDSANARVEYEGGRCMTAIGG